MGKAPAEAIRDMTAALEASEEHFRMLVQGVKDYALFLMSPAGVISTWNPGAERIKGWKAHEIIGQHFSVFYPEEDVRAGKPPRELVIAARDGKYEEEGWRVRKDGSLFWASVLITALRDERGQLRGYAKVTRDLTERRRFEQALVEKNRELERAIRAKDRFLASMSHELRTPLNAIIGFTGTLLMRLPGPLTAEQEKQLRTVQASGKHLLSLINDLLDLAKLNSGKVTLRPEPVVCQEVMREVAESLKPAAAERGLTLEVAAPEAQVVVRADRRALSQILLNLANNALKFTDRGGVRLELAAGEGGGRVGISVVDTGVGISREDRERLFQPFAQVGDEALRERGGAGLGLHISRRLAELMGGEITVESEPGRGSRFTLLLGGR
jgi:PAS domain S-box-containing protein